MEKVNESQKRETIVTSSGRKKKLYIVYIGLASFTELVGSVLSTSGFSACLCLLEASDGFSWDLATSKGDADII